MKKLALPVASILVAMTTTSAFAQRPKFDAPVPDAVNVPVFCGVAGHEEVSPGYGAWLKANLDRAKEAGMDEKAAISYLRGALCGGAVIGKAS